MESNGEARALVILLAGIGIGAVIGMLFAPRSGQETRKTIRKYVDEGSENLKRHAEDLKGRAQEVVEGGKEFVGKGRESLKTAVEAGKQAYVGGKEKLEGRNG